MPQFPGMLFDGGIIDYHFDFSFRRKDEAQKGLVLFPHFFDRITPGWFDKPLRWRKPSAEALSDVVMIAPTDEFVAKLPGAKVPDRNDFRVRERPLKAARDSWWPVHWSRDSRTDRLLCD